MESTVFWLSGVAHRALAEKVTASPVYSAGRSGISGLNRASGSWKPTVPHQKVGLHNGKILIACRTFVHSRQIY